MPPEQTSNPIIQFIPGILIFFIFYFLIIKPQKDKQSEQKKLLNNLAKNDTVVTSSGIHGTIALVKDKTVIVRVDDNVKIEFDKEVITTLTKSSVKE